MVPETTIDYCSPKCEPSLNCKRSGVDIRHEGLSLCYAPSNSVAASTLRRRKHVKRSPRTCIDQISSESNVRRILSSQEPYTRVSGRVASVMDLVSRPGMTEPSTVVNGERTELTGKVALSTSMETSMMDTGRMIRPMVAAYTSMSMGHNTRVCGKMTFSMVTALRHGQTSHAMKETTLSVASMALVATAGTMDLNTLVTGERTKYQVLESIHGLMAANIRESGSTTTWRAWEFTFGTMVECTKASTKMTRSMGSEFTPGLIDAAMKDSGSKENNTVLAPI